MRPAVAGIAVSLVALVAGSGGQKPEPTFRTSDRCIACHNGLVTPKGEDVSIGFEWRASVMANSSRDPYWQASVRREVMDHSESRAHIEDECSICHMPITRYEAKLRGARGEVFSHLPFDTSRGGKEAADGVTCSVCHQITKEQLGTRASFNGGFVVNGPSPGGEHPEYGPFQIDRGLQRVMRSSTTAESAAVAPNRADNRRSCSRAAGLTRIDSWARCPRVISDGPNR